jgi:hypothetical protein
LLLAACAIVKIVATWSALGGAFVGILASFCSAAYTIANLSRMQVIGGPLAQLCVRIFPVKSHD